MARAISANSGEKTIIAAADPKKSMTLLIAVLPPAGAWACRVRTGVSWSLST